MRMSAIRQPVSSCSPDFRKSSADANDRTGKPADLSKRSNAARNDSSSSTTTTIFKFPNLSIRLQGYLDRLTRQLWFLIASTMDIYKGFLIGKPGSDPASTIKR